MRAFLTFVFILSVCNLYRAQEHRSNSPVSIEDVPETQMENKEKLEPQLDIWKELRNLRDMVVDLAAKLAASDNQVQVLKEEITAQAAELTITQQKLSIVQERLLLNVAHVEELQEKQEVSKVAFSTSLLVTGEGNIFHDRFTTLVFRNVFTNIGNHYSPITGFFTAPVRGMYYFRFTGHVAHSDSSMVMQLVKNEDPVVSSGDRYTTTTDPEDNVSNGAVLQLEFGDVISIRLSGNVWDDNYHRTTFSGFLLLAL